MPHLTIDYSANMEDRVDMAGLCDRLRQAAIDTGIFPLAGVRVRAIRADHAAIADGDGAHGYIDIAVRLLEGRDLAVRHKATEEIFAAARDFTAAAMARHSFALSFEMRNIDPELSPRTGSIRAHLGAEPTP